MHFLLLSAAALLLSPSHLPSINVDVDAIRKQDGRWMKAAATKKPLAWTAFYAPGATMLPPNEPACSTKQQILTSITSFLALPNLAVTWIPTKIIVAKSGEIGYSYGVYQISYTDPSGNLAEDHGKNVEVWEKQPRVLEVHR